MARVSPSRVRTPQSADDARAGVHLDREGMHPSDDAVLGQPRATTGHGLGRRPSVAPRPRTDEPRAADAEDTDPYDGLVDSAPTDDTIVDGGVPDAATFAGDETVGDLSASAVDATAPVAAQSAAAELDAAAAEVAAFEASVADTMEIEAVEAASVAEHDGRQPPEGTAAQRATLTERDRAMLRFERFWWRHAGSKEQAIRDTFDLSATHYYRLLNALLDVPAAVAFEPLIVGRLRRLRASRARRRVGR